MGVRIHLLLVSTVGLLLLLMAVPAEAESPAQKNQVLIINSYHSDLSWTDSIMNGIRDAFARSGLDIQMSAEYLDARRYPDPEKTKKIQELLISKVEATRPDLVMVSDNVALNFILEQRNRLFPDTPVVFCGINDFKPSMISKYHGITGVAEDMSVIETVGFVLRVHPNTREIIVIGRTSVAADRYNRDSFAADLPGLPTQLTVTFWDDLPISELEARLEKVEKGSVIFLNGLITDKSGRQLMYGETTKWVCSRSSAPVYSLWDVYLGYGIVGGKLISGYQQGEMAAELAVRILKGESADNLPVIKGIDANRYMFDYRQLEKHRIPESQLPKDAIIINRPDSFYAKYKMFVWAAAVIVMTLSSFVILLVITIIRRRKAEGELMKSEERMRLFFERQIVGMAITSPEKGWLQVNDKLCEMLGYSRSELTRMTWEELTYPDDLAENVAQFDRLLAGEINEYSIEKRFIRKDGTVIFTDLSVGCVRHDNGSVHYILALLEDITKRKWAETQIIQLNALKEKLLGRGDLHEKLRVITEATVQIYDADFARIWITKEGDLCDNGCSHALVTEGPHVCRDRSCCLHLVASSGRYTHLDGNHRRVPLGAYKIGNIASGREAYFLTNDVTHDPRVHDHEWAETIGLASFAGFRLISPDGKPIGVLALFKKQPITPEEMRFLEYLANTTSQVIRTGMAEEALRESEEKFRRITENMSGLVCEIDGQALFKYVSPSHEVILGYKPQDLIGVSIFDLIHPDDKERVIAVFREGVRTATDQTVEFRYRRGDGNYIWLRSSGHSVFGAQGEFFGAIINSSDITERIHAEGVLRESEQKFRAIFNQTFQFVGLLTIDGTIIKANRTALSFIGVDESDVIGKPFYETPWWTHSPELQEKLRAAIKEAAEGKVVRFEATHRAVDGSIHDIDFSLKPVVDEEGNIVLLMPEGRDITELKRAEAERVLLTTAIEQAAEGVIISDTNWIIEYINPAFERISGYDRNEIIARHTRFLKSNKHDENFFKNIRETLRGGNIWSGRLMNTRKDGALYEAEVTASPVRDGLGKIINYVGIHRDITHEMKLEKELRQAQKMEAIGTLAGGIAHDFNNILMAIIGYTEMAQTKILVGSTIRHYLDQVLKAATRAKDLVKQILTFSRRTEQTREPISVAPIVKEVLKLMRSSLPSTIDIHQDITIPPDKSIVMADPTQIHQVLMNLCTNAAYAMRITGGILSVGLSEIEVDALFVSRHPDLKPGHYILLTVSDRGHGMDMAVLERIFDPYFTTKGVGEGAGLGLSVVQGIVKNYGGAIHVYSEPGKGTTFHVYLPKVEESTKPEAVNSGALPTGCERILFIDDEKALVELGKEMLEFLGYTVSATTDSIEALEIFRTRPDDFDLVITDMTMPGLIGIDLSKECMKVRPHIPIILCTGFSDLIDEKQAAESGIQAFVMKPYVITNLANTIRKVLEKK
ncbi:MAG: PAS domain S-box protein [Syntrophaceae bacterium]